MADAFIGEIRAFPFSYIPVGWLACNGSIQPVGQYQALFTLLGTAFGGNGSTTFGLPNLTSLAVMSTGQGVGLTNRIWSHTYGATAVTVNSAQMPEHSHTMNMRNPTVATIIAADGQGAPVANTSWLTRPSQIVNASAANAVLAYTKSTSPNTSLTPTTISVVGGNAAHDNMQPYLPLVYCINFDGTYPIFN